MARLSKISSRDPQVNAEEVSKEEDTDTLLALKPEVQKLTDVRGGELFDVNDADTDPDPDNERRESAVTTASISSYPESAWHSDNDLLTPILSLYTPQPRRPLSPGQSRSPFASQSLQRSRHRPSHGRGRTSKFAWSANARGSPRTRRRISDVTEGQAEWEERHFPLVLLHVSLLPVKLPWSPESIQELLPPKLLQDLQQLRAKVSETILSRGILIAHPREEYELLEERLLEALELKEERVTKCGHFRNRSSVSFASDADSAIGSSVEDSEHDLCAICHHHIRPSRAPVGDGAKKWEIRIFAANGLMKASAWTAAWSDMESVDVEIRPWISEDWRRKLDEKKAADDAEAQHGQGWEDGEDRIGRLVEEKIHLMLGHQTRWLENEIRLDVSSPIAESPDQEPCIAKERATPTSLTRCDIPPIYKRSQIPLSILLKNYFYLLLRDRRSVAIMFSAAIAIFLSLWLVIHRAHGSEIDIHQLSRGVPASGTVGGQAFTPTTTDSDLAAAGQSIPLAKSKSSLSAQPVDPPNLLDDICLAFDLWPLVLNPNERVCRADL